MRKNYQNEEIDTSPPAVPDTVSVALAELAGEMREGLLALAVGTGLQVMAAIMEPMSPRRVDLRAAGSWRRRDSRASSKANVCLPGLILRVARRRMIWVMITYGDGECARHHAQHTRAARRRRQRRGRC